MIFELPPAEGKHTAFQVWGAGMSRWQFSISYITCVIGRRALMSQRN
jgi:hypothetical protein